MSGAEVAELAGRTGPGGTGIGRHILRRSCVLRTQFGSGDFGHAPSVNDEQREFLSLARAPARLTAQEAAWFLGFSEKEISVLVGAGLLKPLGHPRPNGVKYFASVNLDQLRKDQKWLARASDAILQFWRRKNGRRDSANAGSEPDMERETRG